PVFNDAFAQLGIRLEHGTGDEEGSLYSVSLEQVQNAGDGDGTKLTTGYGGGCGQAAGHQARHGVEVKRQAYKMLCHVGHPVGVRTAHRAQEWSEPQPGHEAPWCRLQGIHLPCASIRLLGRWHKVWAHPWTRPDHCLRSR